MSKQIAVVFGSSSIEVDSSEYLEAVQCGEVLAQLNYDVMTGGYGGVMEAVSVGSSNGSAKVYGVTSKTFTFRPEGANPYITDEINAPNIIQRIQVMVDNASIFVVMPGNLGTLNELAMVLTLFKVGEAHQKLYVWKKTFLDATNSLRKLGVIDESVLDLIEWVDDVSQLQKLLSLPR
ncbi:MAG: LOG family protein [Candidatus Cloacimonetes bacterium]|nr:LOG family protein [Candidatus Cloacimonadota bacterium]